MADRPLFTLEAAVAGADALSKSICDPAASPTPLKGKVRLFNETLVPDDGTTRADLEAAEIVLTGYPSGGYDLTAFDTPKSAAGGGVVITSNLINVAYASGPSAICGGYWVEDDATPTPSVREVFIYDPKRQLAVVTDGWPLVVQLGYGANAAV